MSYPVRPGPIGAGLLLPSHRRGPRSFQTGAREVGRTLRHGESKWRHIDLRIPYGQGMEHVAGAAAASLAQTIGFDYAEAKDVEVAVCEACIGLGGRFFVGACETIVVLLRAHPGGLRVLVCGEGQGRSREHTDAALDVYDADLSVGVLRSLMDTVAVLAHERFGFCIAMSKHRETNGRGRRG